MRAASSVEGDASPDFNVLRACRDAAAAELEFEEAGVPIPDGVTALLARLSELAG